MKSIVDHENLSIVLKLLLKNLSYYFDEFVDQDKKTSTMKDRAEQDCFTVQPL